MERVTIEKQLERRGSKETWSIVRVDGIYVGYIRKFKNTRSMTSPWQAFERPASLAAPARVLGEFYEVNGRELAIQAVVDNVPNLPAVYG